MTAREIYKLLGGRHFLAVMQGRVVFGEDELLVKIWGKKGYTSAHFKAIKNTITMNLYGYNKRVNVVFKNYEVSKVLKKYLNYEIIKNKHNHCGANS